MKDVHPAVNQSLKTSYDVLRRHNPEAQVFAVHCCGRIYLGIQAASKCRTCDKIPQNIEIRSDGDLDNL